MGKCVVCCWVVVLFVGLDCVVATKVVGWIFLKDMEKRSPMLIEMGLWDCFMCVWEILAVLSLIVVSMARTKNIGKGKVASSSVDRVVKKRKADTYQVVKKSKGKCTNQSSENEEESEDEEIEEMFDESAEVARAKWA